MSDELSPAKVRLTAGLGPLPEPAAMTTSYEVVPAGQGSAMCPGGTLRACGRVAVGYTADQMRAYAAKEAAAERERRKARAVQIVERHRNDYNRQQIDTIVAELRNGL